jgi:hypothetical protein
MQRSLLIVFFSCVLAILLGLTVVASLDRSVSLAATELWPDPWFKATLADAYFAFLTIYLWVAYKERTAGARIAWLVLFLFLGNFAIATYMLRELLRLRRDGARPQDFLLRRS